MSKRQSRVDTQRCEAAEDWMHRFACWILVYAPGPWCHSQHWMTSRTNKAAADQSPPLVIPVVTVVSISQQRYWYAREEAATLHVPTYTQWVYVNVEDVRLHLPGAASCTPSLTLPNSSRRGAAAPLHPPLCSLSPSTLLCNLYVVTNWCEYRRILCVHEKKIIADSC